MSQLILATKEENVLSKLSSFTGSLSKETHFVMDSVIQRKPDAETPNCGYVHPIPYCLVTFENQVLFYQRTSMSGEQRLSGQYSIGIGGHVDLDSVEELSSKSGDEFIKETAVRELEEELLIEGTSENILGVEILGTLYDTTTEVNKLHLGYICEIKLTEAGYNKVIQENKEFEDHIDNVGFFNKDDLDSDAMKIAFATFESWSQILIQDMKDKTVLFN